MNDNEVLQLAKVLHRGWCEDSNKKAPDPLVWTEGLCDEVFASSKSTRLRFESMARAVLKHLGEQQ